MGVRFENKDIRHSLIISGLLILLVNSRYYWEQIGGFIFPIIGFIIIILGFISIGKIIIRTRLMIRYKILRTRKFLIPIIIYLFALIEALFNPFNLNAEKLQANISFRACYEGTMNTAIIKFRENNKFEFSWGGFMGFSDYYSGTWVKRKDTLIMNYKNKKPESLKDTLIIKDDYFYQILNDSIESTYFYLGYCKGLN